MSIYQPLSSKQAEVSYRRRRSADFTSREPTGKKLDKILIKRAQKAQSDFRKLIKRGLRLSPFLEIGAERGQRSMVLKAKFNAQGYMLDLSLESLQQALKLKTLLKLEKLPKPVVADAQYLPFPDNSFSFVFAYQTLHHFPDPKPIIKEIHRVLKKGGVFFFDEEPIRQSLNLRLWRRPTNLRWWEKILKSTLILHFISEIGKSEVDAGIIEASFDLKTWENALDEFSKVSATLTAFPFGPAQEAAKNNSQGWIQPHPLNHLLLKLFGGNISAVGIKHSGKSGLADLPLFACPACPSHPLLQDNKRSLTCLRCHQIFPKKANIPILIEKKTREHLYGRKPE